MSILTSSIQITPQAAVALRTVRDQILAHPESFNMAAWDCGTHACIGGHLCRMAPELAGDPADIEIVAYIFGLVPTGSFDPFETSRRFKARLAVEDLFYVYDDDATRDVQLAATRINEFLWKFGGYPPEALTDPTTEETWTNLSTTGV